MPFELFVALRYLKAKKRHRALAVNTVVAVVGVMFGVAALIATMAVMNGFKEELRAKILGTNSHVVISHRDSPFGDYESWLAKARKNPQVVGATPFIFSQVLLTSEYGVQGVVVRGVDPEREGQVTDVARNLVAGRLGNLKAGAVPRFVPGAQKDAINALQPGVILGRELALKLGVMMGSSINVLSPVGEMGPMGIIPKIRPFTVVGIFDSGMFEYDSSLAYISLPEAQDFLDMGDKVTGIEVRLSDFDDAPAVAAALRKQLPRDFIVRDWRDMNRNFFSALELERAVMFVILTLIIVVAAFNIVGTLTMMVMEKGREISILKAMGATPGSILKIFMAVGLLIGLTGTLLGFPLGLGVCWIIHNTYHLPGDIYYISSVPVKVVTRDAVSVCAAALAISFVATLYPAWQAAKLPPSEGLRYE